jgi:hypothetical protein
MLSTLSRRLSPRTASTVTRIRPAIRSRPPAGTDRTPSNRPDAIARLQLLIDFASVRTTGLRTRLKQGPVQLRRRIDAGEKRVQAIQ